jgi:recombinational DNA repair protein (RecF pathway)
VYAARGDVRGVAAFARIAELTTRLVHGEEKSEYLFTALAEARGALMVEKCDAFGTIEIVCVARMLYTLGYISTEALSTALFTHTAYTGESLLEAETMRDKLLSSINKAIAETQL